MPDKSNMHGSILGAGSRLLGRAFRMMPRRAALLMGLAFLHSFLQGASLMLLLPVLGSLGVGSGEPTRITEWIRAMYAAMGIPYTLPTLLAFVFLVGAGSAAIGLALTWIGHGMYRRFVTVLRLETYEAIVHARLSHLSGRRRGDAATVLQRMTEQAGSGFFLSIRMLSSCLITVALIIVAFLQAWMFVVIILGLFAICAWPMRRNSQIVHRLARRCHETFREVGEHLAEHLRLLPTIKGLGAENQSLRMMSRFVHASEDSVTRMKRRIEAVRSLWEVLVIGLLCAATYLGAEVFRLPVDRLLVLVGVCIRLVPALQSVVMRSEQLPLLLTAHDEVSTFIRECRVEAEPHGSTRFQLERLELPIELRHVSVRENDKTILSDITLSIAPRSLVALVGPSGSGKTTIAATVLGLVEPVSGEVRIEGVDLRTLDRRSWRQRVGYVAQDVPILTGTIRENLLLAAPAADELSMVAALRAAGSGAYLEALPDGLDTFVGEHGSRISGGERQRLAIARALLRRPVFLILDEATSALDADTAKETLQTVDRIRCECAVLMIAHDLDVVRTADIIYVIEDGHVVEQGTWEKLIAHQGRLSQLAAVQGVA